MLSLICKLENVDLLKIIWQSVEFMTSLKVCIKVDGRLSKMMEQREDLRMNGPLFSSEQTELLF